MSIEDVLNNRKRWHVAHGDSLDILRSIPDRVVQCVFTSPPYY